MMPFGGGSGTGSESPLDRLMRELGARVEALTPQAPTQGGRPSSGTLPGLPAGVTLPVSVDLLQAVRRHDPSRIAPEQRATYEFLVALQDETPRDLEDWRSRNGLPSRNYEGPELWDEAVAARALPAPEPAPPSLPESTSATLSPGWHPTAAPLPPPLPPPATAYPSPTPALPAPPNWRPRTLMPGNTYDLSLTPASFPTPPQQTGGVADQPPWLPAEPGPAPEPEPRALHDPHDLDEGQQE